MVPCLYFFTGISFAGKSVLARRLAAHLGVPRVDPDEVSHRLGLGLSGEFLSDGQWAHIHAIAEDEACAHLRTGTSVVYDTTAFTRQQRDALRALAAACGATTQLLFMDTPRDVAYLRWQSNEQTRQRPRVHADDFAMVADLFESPHSDESALRFTPEDLVDTWIHANVIPDIDAVLFDLDNTLADRRAAFLLWAQWFAGAELQLTAASAVDQAVSALIALDQDGYTPRDAFFQAVRNQFPQILPDAAELVTEFRGQFSHHLPPLDPGSSALLDALDRASIPWGIISNGSARNQRGKLQRLGLEQRATCVLISEELGLRKPDPAIFVRAASQLGVEPRKTMFVGDHPEVDICGAARAGMFTAWLHQGRTWPDALLPLTPTWEINELAELAALLRMR
jgi:putative hydrolase of the HAD superfamily